MKKTLITACSAGSLLLCALPVIASNAIAPASAATATSSSTTAQGTATTTTTSTANSTTAAQAQANNTTLKNTNDPNNNAQIQSAPQSTANNSNASASSQSAQAQNNASNITASLNLQQQGNKLFAHVLVKQAQATSGTIHVAWTAPAQSGCNNSQFPLDYQNQQFHTLAVRTLTRTGSQGNGNICAGTWQASVLDANNQVLATASFDVPTNAASNNSQTSANSNNTKAQANINNTNNPNS